MKLKYFVTCNENGLKTDPELHYWDEDLEQWLPVETEECKTWEYDFRLGVKD